MPYFVTAIQDYAGWLYLLLVLLMLREARHMWIAGQAREVALFALEREAATGRAVRSLVTLFLLGTIAVGVHVVATILAPALPPEAERRVEDRAPIVGTPLAVPLPSDTPTAPPTATRRAVRIVTAPPEPSPAEPTAHMP